MKEEPTPRAGTIVILKTMQPSSWRSLQASSGDDCPGMSDPALPYEYLTSVSLTHTRANKALRNLVSWSPLCSIKVFNHYYSMSILLTHSTSNRLKQGLREHGEHLPSYQAKLMSLAIVEGHENAVSDPSPAVQNTSQE